MQGPQINVLLRMIKVMHSLKG